LQHQAPRRCCCSTHVNAAAGALQTPAGALIQPGVGAHICTSPASQAVQETAAGHQEQRRSPAPKNVQQRNASLASCALCCAAFACTCDEAFICSRLHAQHLLSRTVTTRCGATCAHSCSSAGVSGVATRSCPSRPCC
jgi:hypothetical protein